MAELNFVDNGEGISLRDMVYTELKNAIMRGDFAAGTRLMEIPIADKMGVSRTPVREAIKRLEKDGFVTVIPGCGARVAEIGDKDVTDALDVRSAVEIMAVSKAAQNITEKQVRELRKINDDMRRAFKSRNLSEMSELDSRLHRMICEIADNKVLLKVMQALESLVLRFRVEYLKSAADCDAVIKEHDAIIDALAAGESEEAARLVSGHIAAQRDCICKIIKSQCE